MKGKVAREIRERLEHLDRPMQDPTFQTELKLAIYRYKEATGYLECLEKTIGLEEFIKRIANEDTFSPLSNMYVQIARQLESEWEKTK